LTYTVVTVKVSGYQLFESFMADRESSKGWQDNLSPKEMQEWAAREIADSVKASQLRIKEAGDLAKDYAEGKLSPDEAMQKMLAYDRRWGEALFGVGSSQGLTDENILESIDEARIKARLRGSHLRQQSDGRSIAE
jgi:hypothetical protein